ncbi:hypothetical protein FXO38_23889, partial [Capsicum annuum]
MDSGEDKCKTESLVSGGHTLLDEIKLLKEMQDHTGERKLINSELWDEKSQLLLGVRWANCQQTSLTSSVLSADSMYIGVLAAGAHAAANRSTFTIFHNP